MADFSVISFNGNGEHYQAWGDSLVHRAKDGQYGEGWFTGCLTQGQHDFEQEFGLPLAVAHLIDVLSEGCDETEILDFATDLVKAMKVGANYEKLPYYWCKWLIVDPNHGVTRYTNDRRVRDIGLLHREAQYYTVESVRWDEATLAVASTKEAVRDYSLKASMIAHTAAWENSGNAAELGIAASIEEAAIAAVDTATYAGAIDTATYAALATKAAVASTALAAVGTPKAATAAITARAVQRQKLIELLSAPVFPVIEIEDDQY
jgi:hypothetical protein